MKQKQFSVSVVTMAMIFTFSGCGQDNGLSPGPSDIPPPVLAPTSIRDLVVEDNSDDSVTLTWTAPMALSDSSAASIYDIRFWKQFQPHWTGGSPVDSIPVPKAPGVRETLVVRGLNPSTWYHFAIKSADEDDLWSAVSNAPAVMTDIVMETWIRKYGGDGGESSGDLVALPGGGFLIIGSTTSNGAGGEDVLVTRVQDNGDEIWSRTFGGALEDRGYHGVLTSDGCVLVSGSTKSFGNGYVDIYLLKILLSGELVWEQTYGGDQRDNAYCMAADPDGGFVIGGQTWSFGAAGNAHLIKVDELGDLQWEVIMDGPGKFGGIAPGNHGDWILVGSGGWSGKAGRLFRVSSVGAVIWEKPIGDGGEYSLNSVVPTGEGGFFAGGQRAQQGLGILFNGFGETIWEQRLPVSGISDVISTSDAGFVLVGKSYGMFNPGTTKLSKLDNSGQIEWSGDPRIPDDLYDYAGAVVPYPDGGFLVTGGIDSDIYLMKVDNRGHIQF